MREGWKRGEDAIFLSLAKYAPGGSIMDRISAGQEMIFGEIEKAEWGVGQSWIQSGATEDAHGSGPSRPSGLT